MTKEDKNLVDIWGDNVKLKDLSIAMVLCIAFSLGGFILAPGDAPQPLVIGLLGGLVGFIVSTIIIKPKRTLTIEEEE